MNTFTTHLIFLSVCLCICASLQVFSSYFIYYVPELPNQFWRFVTGHWVHVSWTHLLFNFIAFACLPFIFVHADWQTMLKMLLIFPLLISAMFYVFLPDVVAYAGLSGVLHGMYVAMALVAITNEKDRRFGLLVLAVMSGKLLWEQWFGDMGTAALIGSDVLVEAHFVGAWCGVLYAVVMYLTQQNKN